MPHRFNRRSRFRRPRRRRRFNRRRRVRRRRMVALDPERKDLSDVLTQAVTADGTVDLLNGVPQDVTENGRIGRQHLNLSMMIKYTVTLNPIASIPTIVKVALVWDKQADMAAMAAGDLWENTGTIHAPLSGRVLDNGLRFRVLWSRTHRVDLGDQIRWHFKMKKFRLKTRYVGAGAAVTNIVSGAMYMVMISDVPGAPGGQTPVVQMFHRLRYVG